MIQPDGTTVRLGARALLPGMRILTAAGERFAVDGRVVEGRGEVDESLITGETAPRAVAPGALIHAGTVNLAGSLVTEATATDDNTLLAEIARLMTAAEQGRGRYVRLADRAARLYAPAVHVLGLATFLGWLAAGHGWESALTAAIAVLIITCPCALALAVPAVQVAASSRLFGKGMLIKAPDGLERLAEVDTVVFDKTGTLTLGEPSLAESCNVSDGVLAAAARLAAASRHPYARAVVRAAEARGLAVAPAGDVREVAGFGLERSGPDGAERLGSAAWCGAAAGAQAAVCYRAADGTVDRVRLRGPAAARCGRGGRGAPARRPRNRAPVRRPARGRVCRGRRDRHRALAGPRAADRQDRPPRGAESPGRQGADGRRRPQRRAALAAAHASLSPSTAADISQTAADAVFQGERLAPVLETMAVARAAHRMALQNFAIALAYNVVFVPLAMAGLVTPLLAAIAMSASSIAVTANAVRLRSMRLEGMR